MRHVVVTTCPGFGKNGGVADVIARSGWEFVRCIDTDLPDGGVADYLDRVEYLVVGLVPAHADVINNAPRLRAILKHGVGVDNIDIPAATARRIPVLTTPGANANAVAELALCAMLSLARRVPMLHQAMRAGDWQRHVGSEIAGKVLGIVGMGTVGRILAAKAGALGMKVLANDIRPDREFAEGRGIELCDLPRLLAESDFVSLHIFSGRNSVNFIGREQLALMKPTACLVNYARGELVDLDALADALYGGRLGGAAIDVYAEEPPDFAHRIFACPGVVFTPHSGSDTRETTERMGLMVCEDIQTLIGGGRPVRVLNQEVFA